jgi:hypothetical protein
MLPLGHARSSATRTHKPAGPRSPERPNRVAVAGGCAAVRCDGSNARPDWRGRNGLAGAQLRENGASREGPRDAGRLDWRWVSIHARFAARLSALLALSGCGGGASFSVAGSEPTEAGQSEQAVQIDPPDTGPDALAVAASVDAGPDVVAVDSPGVRSPTYVVGQVIPSTVNDDAGAVQQGRCCIPSTLTPPPGQVSCATVLCVANCVPLECGTCPDIGQYGSDSYTVICPAP